jgi:hypothetical protein
LSRLCHLHSSRGILLLLPLKSWASCWRRSSADENCDADDNDKLKVTVMLNCDVNDNYKFAMILINFDDEKL